MLEQQLAQPWPLQQGRCLKRTEQGLQPLGEPVGGQGQGEYGAVDGQGELLGNLRTVWSRQAAAAEAPLQMGQVAKGEPPLERVMQQQRWRFDPPGAGGGIRESGQLGSQGALPGRPGPQERQAPHARSWSRNGFQTNTMVSACSGDSLGPPGAGAMVTTDA